MKREIRFDHELEEEIRHHIRERADFLVDRGWDPEEARREAQRRFGDPRRVRREMAEAEQGEEGMMGIIDAVRSIWADVRYALRSLRASGGFAAAVAATIALGVGVLTAAFSVGDAVLFRPLDYRDAERLVEVNHERATGGMISGLTVSRAPAWTDDAAGLADGWLAYDRERLVRTDGAAAEALSVVAVSPGFDTLLAVPVAMGRAFAAEDARPGTEPVAILSRAYWERSGADGSVLGRTVRLESGPVTVVGVLGSGVRFPVMGDDPDVLLPLRDDFTWADRAPRRLQAVWLRLAEGVDLEEAQQRADARSAALEAEQPLEGGWRVRLLPLDAHRVGRQEVRRAILILAGTAAVIFLIAMVNGVNLLLVRAAARDRAMAVRRALGGSRGRLVRQLLAEGLVLGALGGAAALGLAWLAVEALAGLMPRTVTFFSPHAIEVESRTLLFALGASLLVGAVLGSVPALRLLGRASGSLAGASRTADDTARQRRFRNALVIGQVALSMALLGGAGLFVRSFASLMAVDTGFHHERIATAMIQPSPVRYPDAAARAELVRRLEEALEARPDVSGVAVSDGVGFSFGAALQAEGSEAPEGQPELIPHTAVGADWLEVTGTELVAGRGFEPADAGTDAAIVDRDLARLLWGDAGRAVGRRFRMGESGEWRRVVGVARELRLMGRDQREGPYQILYPATPDGAPGLIEVAVRTEGDPAALLPVIRRELASIDPEQAIWQLRTAEQALAEEEELIRLLVGLMTALAATAVTLAVVGLYGVLAYSVTRRRRELGIRMALGAAGSRVRRGVLAEGLVVAAAGVAVGLGAALLASDLVEQLLFGVEAADPGTLAAAAALLLAVAGAASFLPARRATRVDPVEVLKAE